jgi:ribosomal-protein-alanine N-acetyltransferase
MIIKTKRLVLRSWEPEDAKELAKIANNPKITKNLVDTFPSPYTLKCAKAWIKTNKGRKRQTHFAITIDNKIAGGIGFSIDKDNKFSAGGGYWLGEEYWGKGIATEALIAVTDYTFKKFKLQRMYAKVYTWNPASARVLEKAGYQLEGTLRKNTIKAGKVVDEWLYSKVK